MDPAADIITTFLDGAHVVIEAISDPAVRMLWDFPSVLEAQLVSGLVGHVARGAVWIVDEYLETKVDHERLDFQSAGDYFATFASSATADQHNSIRARGATVASMGQSTIISTLYEHLSNLEAQLHRVDPKRPIAVLNGATMRLDDYLATRIVEQCVHLDDLARSIDCEPWKLSTDAQALTIATGVEIASRRHGDRALMRALFRDGFADEVLPAL